MEAHSLKSRQTLILIAIALGLVLFVAINVIVNHTLRSARIDLTQTKLYTLSDGTRSILGKIDEPITLRLYFSPGLGRAIPLYANYHERVRDLLDEYASLAGGKLKIEYYDPTPFSDVEDRAVAYRLQGVPLEAGGEQVYFGLAGTNSTDDEEIIPFFQPERERFLEYDLTKLVYNLGNPKRRQVGLLSTLPIAGDALPRIPGQMPQPWVVVDQIRQNFTLRQFGSDTANIPSDLDLMMVVHPKELSEDGQYALDQFVLRGGRALIFVDPNSEVDAQRPDPNGMPGPTASDLPSLFKAWGLEMVKDKIIGDRLTAMKVNAGTQARPQVMDYIAWLGLKPANMNRNDAITGELAQINVASAGILKPLEGAVTSFTPLLFASPGAMALDADKIKFGPDPAQLLKDYKAGSDQLVIAARVSGPAKTAFPDGPPKHEDRPPPPDRPAQIAESQGPINVIVVSDTDMLDDRFWVSSQDFFGQRVVQPSASNGDFVVNALDQLMGGGDLIGLRSRGVSTRPFELVDKIQRDAEQQYRAKERTLQDKLRDTQKKLDDLQTKDQAGGAAILSPEQQKAIEDARRDIITTRQELRGVQRDLRQDIDRLEAVTRAANIGLVPAAVALLAIVLGTIRIQRRRRRAAA
jgi:ABC-type uncharacterized transport system involved in gliding motility auxiliary subunit